MKQRKHTGLDFEVDKLTNSIENVITGDRFPTYITLIANADLKIAARKSGWQFNWKSEFKQPERDVFKLTIANNQSVIQGLISLEIKPDHVYMHLVESAPFNKGKTKVYSGVPGNLVAFACKLAFQRGHDGNVSFFSKSQLVQHYMDTLGAMHIGGRIMVINTNAALKLINKYFRMKKKLKDLDVDFIGGQEPMTKEEALAISAFIKDGKEKQRLQPIRDTKKKVLRKEKQSA